MTLAHGRIEQSSCITDIDHTAQKTYYHSDIALKLPEESLGALTNREQKLGFSRTRPSTAYLELSYYYCTPS